MYNLQNSVFYRVSLKILNSGIILKIFTHAVTTPYLCSRSPPESIESWIPLDQPRHNIFIFFLLSLLTSYQEVTLTFDLDGWSSSCSYSISTLGRGRFRRLVDGVSASSSELLVSDSSPVPTL